jgi:hypothetical protein
MMLRLTDDHHDNADEQQVQQALPGNVACRLRLR